MAHKPQPQGNCGTKWEKEDLKLDDPDTKLGSAWPPATLDG